MSLPSVTETTTTLPASTDVQDEVKTYAWIATQAYGRIEKGDMVIFDMKQPADGELVIYATGTGECAITRWPADVVPIGTARMIRRDLN